MQSPSKQQQQTTYEVPSCTICLAQLVEDLSSLSCGHVFHLICISQHFEYRGTCPNCQKRASLKEARTIHFRLVPNNNKVQAQIKSVLQSLPPSEMNQVEALMKELKATVQMSDKMKERLGSMESDLKSKSKMVDALREEVYRHKVEGDKLNRENRKLKEKCDQLQIQVDKNLTIEIQLRNDIDRLRSDEREYEQMKRFKIVLQEKSQEIVNLRSEMEATCTPPEKMANSFYQLLLMKNLDVIGFKENIRRLSEQQKEKDGQISRQKSTIDALRRELRELKEMGEKHASQRQRTEEMKKKYNENPKQKGAKEMEIQIKDQNSQSLSNRNLHIPNDSAIQSTVRKPFFGHGTTIGGFTIKKKDAKGAF